MAVTLCSSNAMARITYEHDLIQNVKRALMETIPDKESRSLSHQDYLDALYEAMAKAAIAVIRGDAG